MLSLEIGEAKHGGYYVVSGREWGLSNHRLGEVNTILYAGTLPDCL